ncbi:MAG: FAD-dependent oxidoreductase [Panacagrimonas sp.]
MSRITRRGFLAGVAGASTAAFPVGAAPASRGGGRLGRIDTDVVVVGAGYAGLACARVLVNAGRRVVVLEARDRVGGRCFNQSLPAPFQHFVVEAGGEFIGPTQDRMFALAREFGIGTFRAYNTGRLVDYRNGRRTEYGGRIPPGALIGAVELQTVILRLNRLALTVPLATPWTARRADLWDSMTVQDWIDANLVSPAAKSILNLAIISVYSAEPREMSLLYFLQSIHSAGSVNLLIDVEGGAQQDRIVGGSQAIANAMAASLGDRVQLNARVDLVRQNRTSARVSGDGFIVQAQAVVVAMSPAIAARIRFQPLPGAMQLRQQFMQRVPMGTIVKAQAVYPTPFWREDGLNGQATSDAFLTKITFDNTPPELGAPGVMFGLMDGQDARTALLLSPARRRQAVLEALSVYFGPRALDPIGYLEMNWQAEEFSQGGAAGVFPPGVLTAYRGALCDPVGRVYWAGSETSEVWSGYMEGAVRSGERAAREVLTAR